MRNSAGTRKSSGGQQGQEQQHAGDLQRPAIAAEPPRLAKDAGKRQIVQLLRIPQGQRAMHAKRAQVPAQPIVEPAIETLDHQRTDRLRLAENRPPWPARSAARRQGIARGTRPGSRSRAISTCGGCWSAPSGCHSGSCMAATAWHNCSASPTARARRWNDIDAADRQQPESPVAHRQHAEAVAAEELPPFVGNRISGRPQVDAGVDDLAKLIESPRFPQALAHVVELAGFARGRRSVRRLLQGTSRTRFGPRRRRRDVGALRARRRLRLRQSRDRR